MSAVPRFPAAPLDGVVVIDLSRHLPGPLASHLLADLGARVVKVEEPRQGDPLRLAPPLEDGTSPLAALLLSGASSVALDLKNPRAREALLDLLVDADVLLESFRPGTLARLGLDPEELRRRFPHLVICSLSGWGQDGPLAGRSGHDLTYQARAGSLGVTGTMPAVPGADLGGSWAAVASILAALYAREVAAREASAREPAGAGGKGGGEGEREIRGEGTWIDASLYDAALHANLVAWADAAGGRREHGPEERRMLSGALPCYRLYRTADGRQLAVAPLEPRFWRQFVVAVGRPDLINRHLRTDAEAHAEVEALVASRSFAWWRRLLADLDVPVEPVLTPAEAAADPQARARDLLAHGADGLYRLAYPARFDGLRPRAGARLTGLGEDTRDELERAGSAAGALSWLERRRAGVGKRFSLRRWVERWVMERRSRR